MVIFRCFDDYVAMI